MRENLDDFGYDDDFQNKTTKIWFLKERTDEFNSIKFFFNCFGKDNQENEKTRHKVDKKICKRHI